MITRDVLKKKDARIMNARKPECTKLWEKEILKKMESVN
jgi:hypothetical protein